MVSGCAVERIQPTDLAEADRSGKKVTDPVEYPQLCEIPNWDASCWQIFDAYEDVAEGNKDIAQTNANIARASDEAYDLVLSSAKRIQYEAQIREEMLELERKDHFIDNLQHKIAILLLALGLIL